MLDPALQRSLAVLDLDGLSANFRAVIDLGAPAPGLCAQALKDLAAALRRAPGSAPLLAWKGRVLAAQSKMERAREAFQAALRRDPGLVQARAWLGAAFLDQRRVSAARRELDSALASGVTDPWAFFHRAVALFINGETAAAARDLGRALAARGPASSAAAAFLALAEAERSPKRALRLAARVVARERGWWPYLVRSRVRARAGDASGALSDLDRAQALGAPPWAAAHRRAPEGVGSDSRAPAARPAAAPAPADSGRAPSDLLRRVDALLATGMVREGVEMLAAADPKDPETASRLLQGAAQAFGALHLDLAAQALRALVGGHPGHYEGRMLLARVTLARGDLPGAARLFESAWALRPERWEPAFPLGEIRLRQGNLRRMEEALARGARASARDGSLEARVARFRLALCRGRLREAEGFGEAVLDRARGFEELDPLCRPPIFDLDDFALSPAPASYERFIKSAFDRFLDARPESPWACYYYRQFQAKFQKTLSWERSRECLERLMDQPLRRYGWMRYHMGLDLLYGMDFQGASAQFEMSVRFFRGRDWRSLCHIGEALACQGRLPAAWRAFDRAARAAPPRAVGPALAWKGEALLWAGQYRRAISVLDAALAAHVVPLAHCWRGAALLKLGRTREALAALDTAVAVSGDHEARVWRGEALWRLGRGAEALRDARTAVAASRDRNFYAHVLQGLIRARKGEGAALRRELRSIPPEALSFARERLGGSWDSPRAAARLLEGLLRLSRGVRRGDYERAVWMALSGKPSRARGKAPGRAY